MMEDGKYQASSYLTFIENRFIIISSKFELHMLTLENLMGYNRAHFPSVALFSFVYKFICINNVTFSLPRRID